MRAAKRRTPTWTLFAVLLAAGCGSSSGGGATTPDAATNTADAASEPGKDAIVRGDTRIMPDAPPRVDAVVNTTPDAPVVDAPPANTTPDAPPSGEPDAPAVVIDAPPAPDTGGGGGTVDAPPAGTPDSAPPDAAVVVGAGTCDSPLVIPPSSHSDIAVNTAGAPHAFDLPCTTNTSDVVLSFTLTQRELVYADTFGAGFDTVLYFSASCATTAGSGDVGTTTCSDNACGSMQSQAVAVLGYGRHYLVVSGANGASGAATVHFQHTPIGNGALTLLPAGSGTSMGTTTGDGFLNGCEAAGPDNSYWWKSCPDYAGGPMTASTCNGAAFDTVLSLQVPRNDIVSCNDDDMACDFQSTLGYTLPGGAGIQVITVDSSTASNSGNYTLTYTRP